MHELDQKLLRKACDRVAFDYASKDFFCAETSERLLERLDLISMSPTAVLDLGTGVGNAIMPLQAKFRDALIIGADWSAAMLDAGTNHPNRICTDAHHLPLADASVDIVIANMLVPGCADPEQVFREARRVLRSSGLFLFSTLGPDTFKQLRKAWAKVDEYPHVHVFADMHNIGDSLVQAGFREPVMDVERLTVTYTESARLITDLRAVAATNLLASRRRGLTPPALWQRMLSELEHMRDTDGQLPISLEVITGQAWVGETSAGVGMQEGEARFPAGDIPTRYKP